jgi:hypothetical protein
MKMVPVRLDVLENIGEYLDNHSDVKDGPHGPMPNTAMRLHQCVEGALTNSLRESLLKERKLRKAINDLRMSQGPGGIERKDIMLLCDFVEDIIGAPEQCTSCGMMHDDGMQCE